MVAHTAEVDCIELLQWHSDVLEGKNARFFPIPNYLPERSRVMTSHSKKHIGEGWIVLAAEWTASYVLVGMRELFSRILR